MPTRKGEFLMMTSRRLFKSLRACLLILSLSCAAAVPLLAQNTSNAGSSSPQTSSNTSSTTTTTTTQSSRPGQTTTTQTTDNTGSNMWMWVIILGIVALLAIALIAMRGRSDKRA
jgi:LPXTG-motif cell wall-anchored protein